MKKSDFDKLDHFSYNEVFLNGEMKFLNPEICENTAILSMKMINELRSFIGYPIVLHEVYDTKGHATKSYHKRADLTAIDYHMEMPAGLSFYDMAMGVNQYFKACDLKVGLGFYPDWNHKGFHTDPRGYDIRWVRLDYNRPGYPAGYYYDEKAFEVMRYIYGR